MMVLISMPHLPTDAPPKMSDHRFPSAALVPLRWLTTLNPNFSNLLTLRALLRMSEKVRSYKLVFFRFQKVGKPSDMSAPRQPRQVICNDFSSTSHPTTLPVLGLSYFAGLIFWWWQSKHTNRHCAVASRGVTSFRRLAVRTSHRDAIMHRKAFAIGGCVSCETR